MPDSIKWSRPKRCLTEAPGAAETQSFQGLIRRTEMSSKCDVLRVASAACLRNGDAGDHRIPQVARTSRSLPGCHQISGLLGGSNIERYDSLADLVENTFECLNHRRSPFSDRHDLQPEADFKDGNGSCPDG